MRPIELSDSPLTSVANFTNISEKLDPEEIHRIMDGCFKILLGEIHKYEGTINQFTGDGIMALFGPILPTRTTPARACYDHGATVEVEGAEAKEVRSSIGRVRKKRPRGASAGARKGPIPGTLFESPERDCINRCGGRGRRPALLPCPLSAGRRVPCRHPRPGPGRSLAACCLCRPYRSS